MRAPQALGFVVLALVAAGCTVPSTMSLDDAPRMPSRADRSIITGDELRQQHWPSMYDAIEALRSHWLAVRGPDSFHAPGQVQVYLDDVRMGGPSVLRTVAPTYIAYVRWYDGITATARWGLDHGNGVIQISTHPPFRNGVQY
jgi:hypothetical protein